MMGSEYQEGSKFSPSSRSPSDSSNEESCSMSSNNCSRANLEQLINQISLVGLNNTTASSLFFDPSAVQQANLFGSIDQIGDLVSDSSSTLRNGGYGGATTTTTTTTANSGMNGMPNSCSQIFYTAARMNVNDEDTTFFTRECMHLLAKYLAEHSECSLFKSLYVYAPDNLGWLWSLIDWETPVEFDMEVPTQDKYQPFEWTSGGCSGGSPTPVQLSKSNRDLVDCINDFLAQAPMVKFEYRKQLMIGDMYQFLSTVNEIERNTNANVSKSLFLLYFPRFSKYIDNPLRNNMQVKILSGNLKLVKQLDEMICSLVRTRYIDLNEYKQKILTKNQLPTHVEKLIYERELKNNPVFRTIMCTLITDSRFQQGVRELNSVGNIGNMYNKLATSTPAINNNTLLNSFWMNQQNSRATAAALNIITSNYMKDLEKVRMNEELDHNNEELDMILSGRMGNELRDENANNTNVNNTSSMINNSSITTDSYLGDSPFLIEPNQVRPSTGRMNAALDHTGNSTAAFNYDDSTASNADFLYLSSNASLGGLMSPFASVSLNNPLQNQFSVSGHQSTPQHQRPSPSNSQSAVGYRTSTSQLISPVGSSINKYAMDNKMFTTPNAAPGVSTHSSASALKSHLLTPPPSASVSRTNVVGYRNSDQRLNENSTFFDYLGTNPISPVSTTSGCRTFNGKPFQEINEFVPRSSGNYQNNTSNNSHNKSNYGNLSVKLNNISQYSASSLKSPNGSRNGGCFSPNQHSPSSSGSTTSSPQSQITISPNNSLIWLGRLPPKIYSTESAYSRKVFLGGLPWDADQYSLLAMLQQFGQVKLEVPGKDAKHPRMPNKIQERNTPGYLYIIFDQEASVKGLLESCHKTSKNGGEHFYTNVIISNNNNNGNHSYRHNHHGRLDLPGMMRTKEVEVIPWNQDDTSYVPRGDLANLPSKIDSKCTIFVGGLHGMLTARGLAQVMTETFGEVIHAGLDTDKYKYPIGSGRVTFRRREDYVKAIKARFVNIKANTSVNDPSPKFEKTIQIDPYLEDAKCCKCPAKSQKFCRNEFCLDYYCDSCWLCNHDTFRGGEHHGLSRQNKTTNHI